MVFFFPIHLSLLKQCFIYERRKKGSFFFCHCFDNDSYELFNPHKLSFNSNDKFFFFFFILSPKFFLFGLLMQQSCFFFKLQIIVFLYFLHYLPVFFFLLYFVLVVTIVLFVLFLAVWQRPTKYCQKCYLTTVQYSKVAVCNCRVPVVLMVAYGCWCVDDWYWY